ncbi:MAG: hypothetical protein KatS3mg111_3999 [Pirellulaceae bacterium]|nr:MAG: hypothetical protein KatS3mg111_3999 [Pirellulaceae bacterium]
MGWNMCALGILLLFSNTTALSQKNTPEVEQQAIDEPRAKELLADLHRRFHEIRRDIYGNIFLHVTETKTHAEDGKPVRRQVTDVRFWSRDAQYYRIDRRVVESSARELKGSRTRLIVRPEGYVYLVCEPGTDQFAITEFGSWETGVERVTSELFFAASTTTEEIAQAEIVFGALASELEIYPIFQKVLPSYRIRRVRELQDGLFDVESVFLQGALRGVFSVKYDLDHGVVLAYERRDAGGDAPRRESHVTYEYRFDQYGPIPVVKKIVRSSAGGGIASTDLLELEELNMEPAPLGIFSLDAQGIPKQFVWTRRLILLVIGLALLGGFVAYRRMKKQR